MNHYFPYYINYPLFIYRQKPWPTKVFAPFVDITIPPFLKFGTLGPNIGVSYYNLGFIVATSEKDYTASWGGYESLDSPAIKEQINLVRKNGGDIAISFGGSNNLPIYHVAPDAETTAQEYMKVIRKYNISRIDFDIEGDWLEDEDGLSKNFTAVAMLQRDAKRDNMPLVTMLTIPVLPTGITSYGLKCLNIALTLGMRIDGINLMAMDYGDENAPDPKGKMGQYATEACDAAAIQLTQLFGQYNVNLTLSEIYAMLGLVPMIGVNDVPSEVFYLEDAQYVLDYAFDSSLGQISMWSLNRDQPCTEKHKDSTKCSGIDQKHYAFTDIFKAYAN